MSRVEYVAVQCGLLGAVLVEDTDHLGIRVPGPKMAATPAL